MISLCILDGNLYTFTVHKGIGAVSNVTQGETIYMSVPYEMGYSAFYDVAFDSCKIAHDELKEFNDLTQQFYPNREVKKMYPVFFNRR